MTGWTKATCSRRAGERRNGDAYCSETEASSGCRLGLAFPIRLCRPAACESPGGSANPRPVDLRNGVQDELVAGAVGDGSVAVGQTDRP
jgi:hypothetical protein